MQFKFNAIAVALTAALPALAHAQTSSQARETTLEPQIVTATRTARTADDTLASVSVIRRADIERLQPASVAELLTGQPGISMTSNGGTGKSSSVFLRGTESDHTLVMIDGIKVGSATSGGFSWQDLPPEQIERIEIVRGPRSSLYGSEAIGGVIQIFTRKGNGPARVNASLSGGSEHSLRSTLGVSGGDQKKWYSLNASSQYTSGINSCKGTASAGCFTVEPDNDAYRNTSLTARGGLQLAPGYELDANVLHAKADSEFDGGSQNRAKSVQQVLGTRLSGQLTKDWKLALSAGQSQDKSRNYKNAVYSSTFNTVRNTFSAQNDISIGDNQVANIGVDWLRDEVTGSVGYSPDTRRNVGVFGQWQGDFASNHLQASLRGDDNEQFGKHTTGGLAWGYDISKNLRSNLSFGTAFKAPTFNELYYPGFGNPNLQPETSQSMEFGLAGKQGNTRWSASLFRTEVKDLIGLDASFVPSNIDKARITGIETTLATQFGKTDVSANLTWLDPENQSNTAAKGNVLPRRAQIVGRIDMDHPLGALWRVGMTVAGEGKRYDDSANLRKLGGFATLALRADYQLAKDWKLQGKIGNVLDKQYETVRFYNQNGINWMLTLRYQPK